MHLPRSVVLLVVAASSAGCSLADFDVDQPIVEQRVQGSGIPAPLAALFPLPLDLDLAAEIQKRTTGPIDRVSLTSLTLSITTTAQPTGDSDDWSFVDEIEVFVRSSRAGSTLPRVEIARVVAPGSVTSLAFEVEPGVNLQPYVSEGSVVESAGRGRMPADEVTFDGLGVFTVHPL